MDSSEARPEYTLAQAAQLLGISKQTVRNRLPAIDPEQIHRRTVRNQPRIFLTATALEELRKLSEAAKEPNTTENFAGKLPESTEHLAGELPANTGKAPEIYRQAQEIAWLRAQLEEKDRQIAAKDQQIAAAQQLANQAQQLQLVAEHRLIAAGIDPDPEAEAPEEGDTPAQTREQLLEEVQRLRAELDARPRRFWDRFRRR